MRKKKITLNKKKTFLNMARALHFFNSLNSKHNIDKKRRN